MKELMVTFWILLSLLLVHLSSEHPTCEVTHDTKGWHYKISGNDTAPCTRYQWTNGTELVLATHRPRDKSVSDKVIQKSEKYLHLAVCVEDIQRNRECPSQNFLRVVTCPVNCTEMYEVSRSTGRRLTIVSSVLVLFLLLILFLAFLCRNKCKYQTPVFMNGRSPGPLVCPEKLLAHCQNAPKLSPRSPRKNIPDLAASPPQPISI